MVKGRYVGKHMPYLCKKYSAMSQTTKVPVNVYSEMTPNPNVMKFVTNLVLVKNVKTYEFTADSDASACPLAERLFTFPFVSSVFLSQNFISITKIDGVEWDDILLEVREYLSNYLTTGHPIFERDFEEQMMLDNNTEKDSKEPVTTQSRLPEGEAEEKIFEILDDYVRPAVETDGGAIEFHSYQDGVLTLILKGACSGCPSSTATLQTGIKSLFERFMPEVKEVVAHNG